MGVIIGILIGIIIGVVLTFIGILTIIDKPNPNN